jgi:tripartite-type tricarboxylate transporter receptor subunit TctC
MSIRTILSMLSIAVMLIAHAPSHAAPPAGYPDKPIKMVTLYPPGGGTDFFARQIAPRMAEVLGQPVIVDSRPGAGGSIAAVAVAKTMPADGYAFLLGDRGMYALNPSLYDSLQYDPLRDLTPVTLIAIYDFVLVVNPKVLPVKTVADIIAAAKSAPSGLSYAAPGTSSTHSMAMQLFARAANINLVPILYKGGSPALQDVLAGQVGMMFLDRAAATPHIESGALRVIAAAGRQRIAAYPDVPTVAESAAIEPGLKDFEANAWLAFTMRKGTPDGIVQAVREAFIKATADLQLREKMIAIGITPISSTPAQLHDHMVRETALWGKIIRERGIKPN